MYARAACKHTCGYYKVLGDRQTAKRQSGRGIGLEIETQHNIGFPLGSHFGTQIPQYTKIGFALAICASIPPLHPRRSKLMI